MPRVTTYFAAPHRSLPPTDDALALHQSYQGAFNVKSYLERETGDFHSGAALGAAPWHLGELASALCLFDIFQGRCDGTQAYQNKTIHVEEEHVERATALLKVLHLLKAAAVKTVDEEVSPTDPANADDARATMMAYLGGATEPFDNLWSQHLFAAAPGMGEGSASAPAAAPEGPCSEDEEEGEAGLDEVDTVQEQQQPESAERERAAAEAAVPAGDAPMLLGIADVRGLDYGYGDAGVMVQGDTLHAKGLTDRRIMQRTLLMGKPSITSKEACQNMRSSNADGKKALPEPTWAAVMEKGLRDCDVAWFEGRKVMLKAIPTEPVGRINYHNSLMTLCGLSLKDLVEAMQKSKAKHDAKHGAPPAMAARPAAAGRADRSRSRGRRAPRDAGAQN